MIYKSTLAAGERSGWPARRREAARALRCLAAVLLLCIAALVTGAVAMLALLGFDDLGVNVYGAAFLTVALALHLAVSTIRYEPDAAHRPEPVDDHDDGVLPWPGPEPHDPLERLWRAPAYTPPAEHRIRPAVPPVGGPADRDST